MSIASPVSSEPSLADMAAGIYLTRKANAQTAADAGRVLAVNADIALHKWLAIACMAGSVLPELDALIADEMAGVPIMGATVPVSEGRARRTIADNLCPRAKWVKMLADARDKAIATGSPEALPLYRIGLALAFDPNGHPIPPYGAPATPIAEAA